MILTRLVSYKNISPNAVVCRVVLQASCRQFYGSSSQRLEQREDARSNRWKWKPIPISLGIAFIGCLHLYHRYKNTPTSWSEIEKPEDLLLANWKVNLLRALPLRATSRLWGMITHIDLPEFMRAPLYRTWAFVFGSNLNEIAVSHLSEYPNLATFFVRALKNGVRPMSTALMVSPADGRILHFGEVSSTGYVEQVKGVTYPLQSFLQGDNQKEQNTEIVQSKEIKETSFVHNPNHKLFYCVIYLGPGDYHRFHSPTSWNAELRRHFPGDLLSVHPDMLRIVKGLFVYNERVCLLGHWPYGFFSFTAVGATNVGSIRINFDDELSTNQQIRRGNGHIYDKSYNLDESVRGGIPLVKGIEIGAFHLGSTIVLVFEAPSRFQFTVKPGQKIKLGEELGDLKKKAGSWYSPSQWWPYRRTKERSIRESPVKVVDVDESRIIAEAK